MRRSLGLTCTLAALALAGCDCSGDEDPDASGVDGGPGVDSGGIDGGPGTDGGDVDAGPRPDGAVDDCEPLGTACLAGGECCSGRCEETPAGQVCVSGGCAGDGEACSAAADCCSLGCDGTSCVADACAIAGTPCTDPSECCSNACSPGGLCAAAGCRTAGDACDADGACCSNRCGDDGRCLAGGRCRSGGEVCTDDADCCTADCTAGRCAVVTPLVAGESCINSMECRSGACADDGTGFLSCQYLGGCRPYGELCRHHEDCCNYVDAPDSACEWFDGTETLGVCGNPGGCAPAGEVCAIDGDRSGYNECCPGAGPEGNANCQLSTVAPVWRCNAGHANCTQLGQTCTTDAECCSGSCIDTDDDGDLECGEFVCLGDGEACSTPEQCCNGVCVPEPVTNILRCGATCVALGGACTRGADCCDGNCRTDGTCGPPDVECLPLGSPCDPALSPTDCCSGFCSMGLEFATCSATP
jgi:hypothetical protein